MGRPSTAILSDKRCEGRDYVDVDCSWAPAGTGAPTTTLGKGVTVTRTDVGTFKVTFANSYVSLVSATGNVMKATAADLFVQFGAYVAATASADAYITVRTQAGATATEIAADADSRVHCHFVFAKSGVTP